MQQPMAEAEEWVLYISRVLATAIVVRENRALQVSKLDALKDSISLQWLISSLLIVQLLADGTFLLVDGLHRLTAVLQLITANILPADYTVRCVVLRADTPANVLQESKRGQDSYAQLELWRERRADHRLQEYAHEYAMLDMMQERLEARLRQQEGYKIYT
jgi:hypothetical protein